MKSFILTLLIVIVGVAIAVSASWAGPEINNLTKKVASTSGFDASTSDITLSQNVGSIIKGVLSLVGTVFLALTVYAGFLWMTARGDNDQIEKATNIVRRSVVGLIIVIAAYSITAFVVSNVFGVGQSSNQVGGSAPKLKGAGDNSATGFFQGIWTGIVDQAKE